MGKNRRVFSEIAYSSAPQHSYTLYGSGHCNSVVKAKCFDVAWRQDYEMVVAIVIRGIHAKFLGGT